MMATPVSFSPNYLGLRTILLVKSVQSRGIYLIPGGMAYTGLTKPPVLLSIIASQSEPLIGVIRVYFHCRHSLMLYSKSFGGVVSATRLSKSSFSFCASISFVFSKLVYEQILVPCRNSSLTFVKWQAFNNMPITVWNALIFWHYAFDRITTALNTLQFVLVFSSPSGRIVVGGRIVGGSVTGGLGH